jgi:hypothetical protein
MAKKVVASMKKEGSRVYTKAIKLTKNAHGSFSFEERIMPKDESDSFFKG